MVTFVYMSALIMEPKRQPARFGVMVTDFSLLLEAEDTGRREKACRTGIFFGKETKNRICLPKR